MTTPLRPRPPFARVAGAILGVAALLATIVLSASPADAHARLDSSSPKEGSSLTAVPPEVMLRFNEPIKDGLNEISVTSGSSDVAEGSAQVEGSSVYQPVDYAMKPGDYTVSYKVVSADGHPVSGSFSFSYDPPEGDSGADRDPQATPSTPAGSETATGETSEPSSTSPESSTTTGASDGETTGTTSPTSDEAAGDEDQEAAANSTSPWWWALAVVVLLVVIGGLTLLVRARRDPGGDEDVTIEEWRH